MSYRLRKGDKVIVVRGREKGKTGKVLHVARDRGRVLVEGLNRVKKSMRVSRQYPKGGIIEIERSLAIANVRVADPKTGKPTRVGFRIEGNQKVRFAKASGQELKVS